MLERVHVLPGRPGLVVLDPDRGDRLPADGREVVLSSYWVRRLEDGDVIRAGKASSSSERATRPPKEKS